MFVRWNAYAPDDASAITSSLFQTPQTNNKHRSLLASHYLRGVFFSPLDSATEYAYKSMHSLSIGASETTTVNATGCHVKRMNEIAHTQGQKSKTEWFVRAFGTTFSCVKFVHSCV